MIFFEILVLVFEPFPELVLDGSYRGIHHSTRVWKLVETIAHEHPFLLSKGAVKRVRGFVLRHCVYTAAFEEWSACPLVVRCKQTRKLFNAIDSMLILVSRTTCGVAGRAPALRAAVWTLCDYFHGGTAAHWLSAVDCAFTCLVCAVNMIVPVVVKSIGAPFFRILWPELTGCSKTEHDETQNHCRHYHFPQIQFRTTGAVCRAARATSLRRLD